MYDYQNEKHKVFTPEGFNMIEKIKRNMEDREVFTVGELIRGLTGDSWTMLACVDFLEENGDIKYKLKEGAKQNYIMSKSN